MKKLLFLMIFFLCSFSFLLSANALVIDFEDVKGATPLTSNNLIYDGYYGFNWDSFYVLQKDLHPNSGYNKGVVSGEWVAYNSWDNLATVNDDIFNFNGVYATSAWDSLNTLTIKGFLNDVELYSFDYIINNQAPSWIDANFTGINKLSFDTSGSHFAIDDFTFNETSPTPEPSTLILFGLGILGIAGVTRKKCTK
jgi:hypothetical protein